MSCEQCEEQQNSNEGIYYFRIGNAMIGFGNIAVISCDEHASLLQAIIRGKAKRTEDGQWVKT